jgi:hypothetical protein
MSVVVEQTIPFAKDQLDLGNAERWATLLPLLRPSIKVVKTARGRSVLVDQGLANNEYVRIAVIGQAGNLSSKLLSDDHITALTVGSSGKDSPSSLELENALKEAGHTCTAGLVVLKTGEEKSISSTEKNIVEVAVDSDLKIDHLVHLVGAATESTRYFYTKV